MLLCSDPKFPFSITHLLRHVTLTHSLCHLPQDLIASPSEIPLGMIHLATAALLSHHHLSAEPPETPSSCSPCAYTCSDEPPAHLPNHILNRLTALVFLRSGKLSPPHTTASTQEEVALSNQTQDLRSWCDFLQPFVM